MSSRLISWALVPLLHFGMIWLHLGLYSCWLMYWLNKPSNQEKGGWDTAKLPSEQGRKPHTLYEPPILQQDEIVFCLVQYLSQLYLWVPHRHQNRLGAPAGHAGGWAWGAPAQSESSSAVTRRPLCSYVDENVWGKGEWLPVLYTAKTQQWGNRQRLKSAKNIKPQPNTRGLILWWSWKIHQIYFSQHTLQFCLLYTVFKLITISDIHLIQQWK